MASDYVRALPTVYSGVRRQAIDSGVINSLVHGVLYGGFDQADPFFGVHNLPAVEVYHALKSDEFRTALKAGFKQIGLPGYDINNNGVKAQIQTLLSRQQMTYIDSKSPTMLTVFSVPLMRDFLKNQGKSLSEESTFAEVQQVALWQQQYAILSNRHERGVKLSALEKGFMQEYEASGQLTYFADLANSAASQLGGGNSSFGNMGPYLAGGALVLLLLLAACCRTTDQVTPDAPATATSTPTVIIAQGSPTATYTAIAPQPSMTPTIRASPSPSATLKATSTSTVTATATPYSLTDLIENYPHEERFFVEKSGRETDCVPSNDQLWMLCDLASRSNQGGKVIYQIDFPNIPQSDLDRLIAGIHVDIYAWRQDGKYENRAPLWSGGLGLGPDGKPRLEVPLRDIGWRASMHIEVSVDGDETSQSVYDVFVTYPSSGNSATPTPGGGSSTPGSGTPSPTDSGPGVTSVSGANAF